MRCLIWFRIMNWTSLLRIFYLWHWILWILWILWHWILWINILKWLTIWVLNFYLILLNWVHHIFLTFIFIFIHWIFIIFKWRSLLDLSLKLIFMLILKLMLLLHEKKMNNILTFYIDLWLYSCIYYYILVKYSNYNNFLILNIPTNP